MYNTDEKTDWNKYYKMREKNLIEYFCKIKTTIIKTI